jgi:hypothetical protein
MDYVYIARAGENEELKYSLRSIEKNMPKGRVWVLGYRPVWYIGDFIYIEDTAKKFDNIRNCIKVASEHPEISDDFVLMNDDFFALKTMESVPNFHGGLLSNKIKQYKELGMASVYIRLLELTHKQLVMSGIKDPIDYDIHVPMVMNKNKLRESLDIAYFPRSSYGNFAKIGGEQIKDVKIYNSTEKIQLDKNLYFVSVDDRSFLRLKDTTLESAFPMPSSLENPEYSLADFTLIH